jgi:NTE family protein
MGLLSGFRKLAPDRRPRLGVALGSGAARGIAHVGVLKALAEARVPIDFLAGSSAGAVIGAIYAGAGIEALLDAAGSVSLTRLARPTLSKRGLASSAVIEELVVRHVGDRTFRELAIPLTVVATDLKSGREVLLNTGRVALAARASAGFVGLFAPVEINGMMLVDGGVTCAAPVAVVRGMGADLVIASDVLPDVVFDDFPEHIFGIVTRTLDILIKKAEQASLADADFVITPIRDDIGSFDTDEARRLVEMGEAAARDVIPEILRAIGESGAEEPPLLEARS